MPEYNYNARDQKGKSLSGQRNAGSAEELANQLMEEGFMPLDISVISGEGQAISTSHNLSWFTPKVTHDELHIFCRQMYSLVHAGIPIATAVTRLAETTRNPTLADALEHIVATLNKGSALHVAMAQFPNIFSNFFLNLITVGESTGNLDNIFLHLAE